MNHPKLTMLAPLIVLTACQTPMIARDQGSDPYQLAGTAWLLIEQGPASASGNLTEVRPYAYTMTLAKDGKASFKLDCNNGAGSWKNTARGAEGNLAFGPLAVTSALCPSGSIAEQLARKMDGSVDYSIYDGRLTMRTHDPDWLYVWDSID